MSGGAKNILLVWELGGSLGHLARLRPLARLLGKHGHKVSFAIRQTAGVQHLPKEFPVYPLATPVRGKIRDPIREPANFADILYNDGITLSEQRLGMVNSTRHLLELIKPDLVVGDFSPWTLLALQGMDLPQALLGTGFACPPPQAPLPDLRAWQDHYPERIQATEHEVVEAINTQLEQQGCEPVDGVGALFQRVAANVLCTLPELDHYPQRMEDSSGAHHYAGVWSDLGGTRPEWPKGEGQRVFAYLKPFRGITRFLDQLERSDAQILVYTRAELPPGRWSRGNLKLVDQPLDMPSVMNDCDLVICHAGHGTTATALLAGKPVLALPILVEQYHTGANVMRMNAGQSVNIDQIDKAMETCKLMLQTDKYRRGAQAFARRYKKVHPQNALLTAMDQLLTCAR